MITAVVVVNNIEKNDYLIKKEYDLALKDRTIPIVLEYLAEGGANVVLRLVPFARASRLKTPPDALVNKLLRVRKDKGFIASAKDQQDEFEHTIAPLFPAENLVNPILVSVDRGFLVAVNQELANIQADNLRPARRKGDIVNEREQHATLMTDMSPIGVEISLEIKPKWLLQSPNAPANATRCRTCALRAQRLKSGRLEAKKLEKSYCPLSLLSDNRQAHLQAGTAILKANKSWEWMTKGDEAFANLMPSSIVPVLQKIRDYQARLDPNGILAIKEGEEPPPDYLLAMTLRDCAMFLRTPKSLRQGPVEVRLADLDAKMPHPEKIKKWRETEETLINEGWYECKEEGFGKEDICLLSKAQS
ncbi:inositol-pentakisphosphate 2-kinase [Elsinoe ampelina]|uniref:Inositol-pentakisphosphate 2-kinase n=1 Tax=Elsinoe ampelina TaxID=302913 RepID=A0A6A6G906_9PEZI|nr:inositol-pentakisphosphate 2-kinase [Elsinoe ampelina]